MIERALHQAEAMVDDASALLATEPGAADGLLRRFVSGNDPTETVLLGARIAANLVRLKQAMAPLRRDKNSLLGFAAMTDGGPDPVVGMSLPNSLRYPIDPLLINNPVIYLDPLEVIRSRTHTVAATYLHELTHALLGTFDSFQDALEGVYVKSGHAGYVDIADLVAAAQKASNDPCMHAATLENLIVLLAYRYRGDPGVADIYAGLTTIYQRSPA